ncbi:hypothetical protein H2248_009708 [Termitomyces sp. 'cryptogamus']|nr:hypothetical protein H2248_009708 [Termitomyces sp. 'cryptogamus']
MTQGNIAHAPVPDQSYPILHWPWLGNISRNYPPLADMLRSTTVLHVTRDALEIAGSIVPFVGAAAVVVREITDRCDEIHVHRRKAKRMARKCLQLQNILDEQNPDRVGEEMRKKIDEAYGYVLIHVLATFWIICLAKSLRDDQK